MCLCVLIVNMCHIIWCFAIKFYRAIYKLHLFKHFPIIFISFTHFTFSYCIRLCVCKRKLCIDAISCLVFEQRVLRYSEEFWEVGKTLLNIVRCFIVVMWWEAYLFVGIYITFEEISKLVSANDSLMKTPLFNVEMYVMTYTAV